MSTRAETINETGFIQRIIRVFQSTTFEFQRKDETMLRINSTATSAADTLNVPKTAIQEYQSIVPLKGMFANDPAWNDLPTFLETYWQEIDGTVETD